MLESWRQPSGENMTWMNLKHILLLSFVGFKLIELTRGSTVLPLWDALSFVLMVVACYYAGFIGYRYLKRYWLAFTVASYKKAVLITGCDTGFGGLLAQRLAARGFLVFAGCLNPGSSEVLQLAAVPNIVVLQLDVTAEADFQAAVTVVSAKLDQTGNELWCVVCNAGVCDVAEFEWQSWEAIERTMNVNVMGAARTVRALLPALRRGKGRVVLNASVLSNVSSPGFIAYSMSKAALASLGEGLKRELLVWDIDVCTVQPALYSTGLLQLETAEKKFFNQTLPELPEAVRHDYGHEYFAAFWTAVAKFIADYANPKPTEVVDALYHAITTVWPETHYRVGSWKQLLVYNLFDYMPIEVIDFFFNRWMEVSVLPNAVLKS